jgi:hypothetical protein
VGFQKKEFTLIVFPQGFQETDGKRGGAAEKPRESGAERKHSLVNTQVSSFPPYKKSRMAKDWSQGKVLIFNETFHYGSLARSTWSPSISEWPRIRC